MADPRVEWVVYDGEGRGPEVPVVREFTLHQGGGERLTSKDDTKAEAAVPDRRPWAISFDEAVAAVKTALQEAHLVELDRLEARLTKQKDDDLARLKAAHAAEIERLTAIHEARVATQSAGVEKNS